MSFQILFFFSQDELNKKFRHYFKTKTNVADIQFQDVGDQTKSDAWKHYFHNKAKCRVLAEIF